MVKHEINTPSLLCFRSVEVGGQTWDKYTILVMFQIRGGVWSAVFWLLQRRGAVSVNRQVCRRLWWSLCHWQSLWHCHCFCILQLVLSTPLFDGGILMVTLDSTVWWGILMVTLDSTVWWGNSHGYFRQHCLMGNSHGYFRQHCLMGNSHGYFRQHCLMGEFSWLL